MEQLSELVEQVGGWRVIIAAMGGLGVVVVLRKLLSRPPASAHHSQSSCPKCGWSGTVSKYKPVCPKCARPLGSGA